MRNARPKQAAAYTNLCFLGESQMVLRRCAQGHCCCDQALRLVAEQTERDWYSHLTSKWHYNHMIGLLICSCVKGCLELH